MLAHYTPVKSYYKLIKTIEVDPEFDVKKAQKKLRRFVEGHEYAIRLKAEIMVDHFHEQVIAKGKIGGQARAMVVTGSIERAVKDGATVPIYYESRLAKLELDEAEKPKLDEEFEEATEGKEVEHKERLKTKWAQLEALVGAEKRLKLIAEDLVKHFEERLSAMTRCD